MTKEALRPCGLRCTSSPATLAIILPAYLPDLLPIELAFSKLKQKLRRVGARTRDSLETAIGEALGTITAEDAKAYFRHCGYS